MLFAEEDWDKVEYVQISTVSHCLLNSHLICCPTSKAYKNLDEINHEQMCIPKIKISIWW